MFCQHIRKKIVQNLQKLYALDNYIKASLYICNSHWRDSGKNELF